MKDTTNTTTHTDKRINAAKKDMEESGMILWIALIVAAFSWIVRKIMTKTY